MEMLCHHKNKNILWLYNKLLLLTGKLFFVTICGESLVKMSNVSSGKKNFYEFLIKNLFIKLEKYSHGYVNYV